MHYALSIILGLVLLTACSGDDDGLKPAGNDERVPLEIAAGINSPSATFTRALETAWEENDQIGVFVTARNDDDIYIDGSGAKGFNRHYTFDDGTNYETNGNTYRLFSANEKKVYLPSYAVDIYGIYPYKPSENLVYSSVVEKENPTVLPSVPVKLDDQSSQKAIDLMRARVGNISNSSAIIQLLFYHRMTKLVFNLKQGEGLLEDELKDASYMGMTIDKQFVEANYSINDDVFTKTSADYSTIDLVRASSAPTGYVRTYEAIVLPNSAGNPAQDRTVTITFYTNPNDRIVNTFVIPESTYFNKGTKYTFNVTVNATSIQVNTTNQYTEQW